MSNTTTWSFDQGSPPGARARSKGPFLVVVLDGRQPIRRPLRVHLDPRVEVRVGRGAHRSIERREGRVELRVPDGWMSSSHFGLRSVGKAWIYEDAGAKNLTSINGTPCRHA